MSDLKRTEVKSRTRELNLTLPIPPSVNKIYVNTSNGGRRLTSRAETYIRETRAFTRMLVEDQSWEKKENSTWLYMDMVFYFPDKRIRDSHNCLKILLDAIEGVVFENDYYVLPRIQSVEYDPIKPRVEIKVFDQTKKDRLHNIEKVVK